jgi:hypothetical protein
VVDRDRKDEPPRTVEVGDGHVCQLALEDAFVENALALADEAQRGAAQGQAARAGTAQR